MAKLSDLPLDPHQGPGQARRASEDELRQRDMFCIQCDFLLDDERWRFAWDTVSSMKASVEGGLNPTDRMWQALKNIEEGGRRAATANKRWGRRYEGR